MNSANKLFYLFFVYFLFSFQQGNSQQIIIYVHNPSAMAIRGISIPGQVIGTAVRKFTNTTIHDLIREHQARINIYRVTITGNISSLAAIQVACATLLEDSNKLLPSIIPFHYIPGFRDVRTRLTRAEIRFADMSQKLIALAAFSSFLIDGSGYLRVAHQTLANDYINIYKELRDIFFKLRVLQDFITTIQTINL